MSAHTPGPWTYSTHKNGWSYTINISQADDAAYTPDWSDVAWCTCQGERQEIQEANARLIAAAPCLLDAHEADRDGPDFLDWVAARLIRQGDNPNSDFILCLRRRAQAARAAIAKARGAA